MCPKWCGDSCYKESLKQPMRFTATEFERIQGKLNNEFNTWNKMHAQFIALYEKCLIDEDCQNNWDYRDVEYEKFFYRSFKRQLRVQGVILKQIRLLQVTDTNLRQEMALQEVMSLEEDSKREEVVGRPIKF